MLPDMSLYRKRRLPEELFGGTECHWKREGIPVQVRDVKYKRVPRILVNESELGNRPCSGDGNSCRRICYGDSMIDRLVRNIRLIRCVTVVISPFPRNSEFVRRQEVDFAGAGALHSAQDCDIRIGEDLSHPFRIHRPGDLDPTGFVGPKHRLSSSQGAPVGPHRLCGVHTGAVFTHSDQSSAMSGGKTQNIVRYGSSRSQQDHRNVLEGDIVFSRFEPFTSGRDETQCSG